ncbi:MAG: SprT-like domain-containing protein [Cyclobacteriaceae bacterium]
MNSRVVFERFVPKGAVDYCDELYQNLGFEFKIKKGRLTKLGDYRFIRKTKEHIITINNDLNPFAFLITYLHEVAHLITYNEFKGRVSPHGKEWKQHFTVLAQPMLNQEVFPPPILIALNSYFKNPKASSCSDPHLFKTLRLFDEPSNRITLEEIPPGKEFRFNKRVFIKEEKKRTRWICSETASKRKYLIPSIAEVELLN